VIWSYNAGDPYSGIEPDPLRRWAARNEGRLATASSALAFAPRGAESQSHRDVKGLPMKTLPALSAILVAAAGCGVFGGSDHAPLEVVPSVDLTRYAGRWYEIASIPVSQQDGCRCTVAEYTLQDDGTVRVVNTCLKGGGGAG